ncbi:phosphatidylethanolamine N-methyltransferase isoform X1 [Peromyscus eremicus]|uniref:phosphatidylethanolamine N-methyltransferase isoform X1 n=1 Tax=Peromyscus eremicus TaxID=42410 RepID=UPI0027DD8693|nr:phosphatidylethanolamine N-methyltransferase isoform X1 [Peromyscus eremicus]
MPRGRLPSQAAGRGPHVSPSEGAHGVEGDNESGSRTYEQLGRGTRLLRRPRQYRLQADLFVMTWLLGFVDPTEPSFVAAVFTIVFSPLFWNVVARWEQRTRKLSRAFGSPYLACYFLGGSILLLNVLRSHCFTQAMMSQPKMEGLDNHTTYFLGLALLGGGIVFVLSSFFALGFTGTFLGDYFGILKEARVTTFPFNVLDNPMYWGSTANYLGWALMNASPTGLLLTVLVALVYVVALLYEEPFTAEIYQQKATRLHKRS